MIKIRHFYFGIICIALFALLLSGCTSQEKLEISLAEEDFPRMISSEDTYLFPDTDWNMGYFEVSDVFHVSLNEDKAEKTTIETEEGESTLTAFSGSGVLLDKKGTATLLFRDGRLNIVRIEIPEEEWDNLNDEFDALGAKLEQSLGRTTKENLHTTDEKRMSYTWKKGRTVVTLMKQYDETNKVKSIFFSVHEIL